MHFLSRWMMEYDTDIKMLNSFPWFGHKTWNDMSNAAFIRFSCRYIFHVRHSINYVNQHVFIALPKHYILNILNHNLCIVTRIVSPDTALILVTVIRNERLKLHLRLVITEQVMIRGHDGMSLHSTTALFWSKPERNCASPGFLQVSVPFFVSADCCRTSCWSRDQTVAEHVRLPESWFSSCYWKSHQ